MYLYLYSYSRETVRQLRMYAQLTRCFSAVAELLVFHGRQRRPISQH